MITGIRCSGTTASLAISEEGCQSHGMSCRTVSTPLPQAAGRSAIAGPATVGQIIDMAPRQSVHDFYPSLLSGSSRLSSQVARLEVHLLARCTGTRSEERRVGEE